MLANPFRRTECGYLEELAVWQITHGTDRHDMTPAQRQRWRLWVRCLNADIDPARVLFARWRAARLRRTP